MQVGKRICRYFNKKIIERKLNALGRAICNCSNSRIPPSFVCFCTRRRHSQPIDTAGLESLGADWRKENPYRGNAKAIEIGASGYNQNCARCHGLEVISGGLAPDLRYLELGAPGDEWFIERIRHGARKQDGTTIMPAFEGVFTQEAMWAIRAYIESVHVD